MPKLNGPISKTNGVQYVEAMKGLVTYGFCNELSLFDAAGQSKKLDGPISEINSVQYIKR